jgi:hypothetical protein
MALGRGTDTGREYEGAESVQTNLSLSVRNGLFTQPATPPCFSPTAITILQYFLFVQMDSVPLYIILPVYTYASPSFPVPFTSLKRIWRQHGPPKWCYPTTSWHSIITTQKTVTWIVMAVKTSYLTKGLHIYATVHLGFKLYALFIRTNTFNFNYRTSHLPNCIILVMLSHVESEQ